MEEPAPQTIRTAAEGDLRAFESLMRAYQAHVFRFLRHLVGDATLAEDLTQETFLRVYRRLGSFRFQSKFSTWLFQIARNAATDELRSQQRRARLLTMAPAPPGPSAPDARAELQAALASLSPTLREALLLVEIFGLAYAEVAEVLALPVGTVKSRVFHARQRLHEWRGDVPTRREVRRDV
ncbi:MAG: sigma-70 family RNA polymerase sigma factor [Acidimicrobiales bacterium]